MEERVESLEDQRKSNMLQGPAFVYAQEVCAVWLSGSSLRCSLPLADALASVLVSDTATGNCLLHQQCTPGTYAHKIIGCHLTLVVYK